LQDQQHARPIKDGVEAGDENGEGDSYNVSTEDSVEEEDEEANDDEEEEDSFPVSSGDEEEDEDGSIEISSEEPPHSNAAIAEEGRDRASASVRVSNSVASTGSSHTNASAGEDTRSSSNHSYFRE
jgi:hypothetical protein